MWIVVLQSDFHHLWASNTSLSIDFHFKVIHYSNSGEFYILSPLNSSHKTPNVCRTWLQSKGSFGILCGREVSAVGGTCRVAVVCRIAVFFSCEELAAAGEERHGSCNALPSHRKHELFLLPIKPLNPPVLHCFILRTHTHTHHSPGSDCCLETPLKSSTSFLLTKKKGFLSCGAGVHFERRAPCSANPPSELWNHRGVGVTLAISDASPNCIMFLFVCCLVSVSSLHKSSLVCVPSAMLPAPSFASLPGSDRKKKPTNGIL